MTTSPNETFTIGVFKDVTWAARGLEALAARGFGGETLSILARATPELAQIAAQVGIPDTATLEVEGLGSCVVGGALVAALQGSDAGLARQGLARSIRRVGFQAHDGQIYETLAERGGVLVAVHSESRAADALGVFHAYGGGNAAIGAWHGRV